MLAASAHAYDSVRVSTPSQPARSALRVGLVGPGRTRDGLGPFLARHLLAAGARVVAVCGRDLARTTDAAQSLARSLGNPVAAHVDLASMLRTAPLDALVIAAPIASHLPALQQAVAFGLPTLCEKPLVDADETDAALAALQGLRAAGAPLVENCQWPYALRALRRLGAAIAARPARFAQRLSPSGAGRSMLVDSLSHFLSLLQEVAAIDGARCVDVEFSSREPQATEMTLSGALRAPDVDLEFRLELVQCPQQPRPAWFAVDDLRCERHLLLPQYHWQFEFGGRRETVGDPQASLVYDFVSLASEPRSESNLDVARSLSSAIRTRARLFREIVGAYDR